MISRFTLDAAAKVAEYAARRPIILTALPAPWPGDEPSQTLKGDAPGTEPEEPVKQQDQHPPGGPGVQRTMSA